MKIIVKTTFKVDVSTTTNRCSDGHYRISTDTKSINLYSDTDTISSRLADKLSKFINVYTKSEEDRVFGGGSYSNFTEKVDLEVTNELVDFLNKYDIQTSIGNEECSILLNPILGCVVKRSNSILYNLSSKRREVKDLLEKKKRELELNANIEIETYTTELAIKSFYENEDLYPTNDIMFGFDLYPLDYAQLKDDVNFLDYLIEKGAKTVTNSYQFAIWLCQVNRFDYLPTFIDIKEIKLEGSGGSELYRNFIFYSIVYNRLDLFFEYGKNTLKSGVYEDDPFVSNYITSLNLSGIKEIEKGKNLGIGQIALKYSSMETIKMLISEIPESFYTVTVNERSVLDVNCFRDLETASLFVKSDSFSSTYAMLYWKKIAVFEQIIKTGKFDFSYIPISLLNKFLIPENNFIFLYLASVNVYFLIEPFKEKYTETSSRSLIDYCIELKNFELAEKLFVIVKENVEITNEHARHLLISSIKYDNTEVSMTFKQDVFQFISSDYLLEIFSHGCITSNVNLINFLISHIENINTIVKMDLDKISNRIAKTHKITSRCYEGTMLHFSTLAFSVNIDLVKILLNAGASKNIADKAGKLPINYLESSDIYTKENRKALVELLYVEGVKVCNAKGELMSMYEHTELSVVNKIKDFKSKGIDAVSAFQANQLDILNFFLTYGADVNSLKEIITIRTQQENTKTIKKNTFNRTNHNSSYNRAELRDMYRDAFDGQDDAMWNID